MKTFITWIALILVAGCDNQIKREYYKDGSLFLLYGVDSKGKLNGQYVEFYPKGDTSIRCTYYMDKLNGEFVKKFENEQEYYSVEYEHGRLMKIRSYRLKNNQLITEDSFKNGNGLIYVYNRRNRCSLERHVGKCVSHSQA